MNGNAGSRKELSKLSRDQLRELARARGVQGFGSMRKPELVDSLSRTATTREGSVSRERVRPQHGSVRLLTDNQAGADRLEAEPLDTYWLRVGWVLTAKTMERAVMAMGADWHRAKSTLRLYRLTCDDAGPRSKTWEIDIPIPPQVNQWFVNVPRAGGTWQLELGYAWGDKSFFTLMHGQPVTLPAVGTYSATPTGIGQDARLTTQRSEEKVMPIQATISVDMVVRGTTEPGTRVTIEGDQVPVSRDGSFRWQSAVVEGRVAIPIAIERDAAARQRILMAVERNTRFLEPEALLPE